MHDWKPYSLALVPGILNVPVSQCCSRRTEELLVKPIDGASGITQHAVDTGGELIVSFQFLCALTVFTLFRRRLFLPDYPRLDLHYFRMKSSMLTTRSLITGKCGNGSTLT